MKEKKLIIYGVGRFAEYAAFLFNNDSEYEVVGFCMEASYLKKGKASKIHSKIVPFEELEQQFPPEDYTLFVAVGNNLIRQRIFQAAKEKDYSLASYISSKAVFWESLKIGENSFIGEGSTIQPFVEIGANNILFATRIGHHCILENHLLLSSCVLAGNVRVGDFSFLGLNVAVKENIIIAEKNIIGMGSIISFDTELGCIYTSPTAVKRKLNFDEIYKDLL